MALIGMTVFKVSRDTFKGELTYITSDAKRPYVQAGRPRPETPDQDVNNQGVPVWRVRLLVEPWRGEARSITVNVPSHQPLADTFSRSDAVELIGLTTGWKKTDRGDWQQWWTADGIEPASTTNSKAA